jgi:hypothetical protein
MKFLASNSDFELVKRATKITHHDQDISCLLPLPWTQLHQHVDANKMNPIYLKSNLSTSMSPELCKEQMIELRFYV